jgi:hypothetical protein
MLYTKGEGRQGPMPDGSQVRATTVVAALAEGSGEE